MNLQLKSRPLNLKIFPDYNELSSAAAEYVINLLLQAIAERGSFHMALAGGSTPRQLYERLVSPRFSDRIPWHKVHLYLGDERFVPPDHNDSNYRMISQQLLQGAPIPAGNIHRVYTELGEPDIVAKRYGSELNDSLPKSTEGALIFDLVLLGVGADGHVASLFPGTTILEERHAAAAAVFVPHLSCWRISITMPIIEKSRHILALISGSEKAQILHSLVNPDTNSTIILPIQLIIQSRENVDCYADQSAAQNITEWIHQ